MSKILETRRVFETIKDTTWEYEWVKNPMYDPNQAREYQLNGMYYPIEE